MTDHAVRADDGLELPRAVDHRAVLHRCTRADDDPALVSAQHRLRPDRYTGAYDDIADDRALRVHERIGIDLRGDVTESVESHAA